MILRPNSKWNLDPVPTTLTHTHTVSPSHHRNREQQKLLNLDICGWPSETISPKNIACVCVCARAVRYVCDGWGRTADGRKGKKFRARSLCFSRARPASGTMLCLFCFFCVLPVCRICLKWLWICGVEHGSGGEKTHQRNQDVNDGDDGGLFSRSTRGSGWGGEAKSGQPSYIDGSVDDFLSSAHFLSS